MSTFTLLLILLALNAFFACAEMSISTCRRIKLEPLAKMGDKKAKRLLSLLDSPESYISVIQIGLNIIAIVAGVVAESALSKEILQALQTYANISPTRPIELTASAISILAITWLFIVFAELIPKKIALSKKETMALKLVTPLSVLLMILKPFVETLNYSANMVLSFFGANDLPKDKSTIADIYALVDQSSSQGVILEDEQHLIKNVFQLDARTVSSAMTHRSDITYLDMNDSESVIKEKISLRPHSRFLLCDSGIDSPLGYINASVLLKKILSSQGISFNRENLNEMELQKILLIPDTLSLLDLLIKFQESRQDIACIVSEYGMVVGIITLNDIMATLMGQSMPSPEQTTLIVARQDFKDSWLIDGRASIADVKALFDWSTLPAQESYETISGFLVMLLKRLPKVGDKATYLNVEFEVVDVDGYRVDQCIATIKAPK